MDGWIKILATWEEMNHQKKKDPHKSQFIKSILSDYTIIFSSGRSTEICYHTNYNSATHCEQNDIIVS